MACEHPTSDYIGLAYIPSETAPREIDALRAENKQLRDLVAQLSKLVVGNVLAQTGRATMRLPRSNRCS
jgi:hypothetical protein